MWPTAQSVTHHMLQRWHSQQEPVPFPLLHCRSNPHQQLYRPIHCRCKEFNVCPVAWFGGLLYSYFSGEEIYLVSFQVPNYILCLFRCL